MSDYLKMGSGDMLTALGTDTRKWAEAFRERFPDVPEDEARAWFANAMMTMWDHTNSEIAHNDHLLVDRISQLVRNRALWRELAESPDQ